MYLYEFVVLYIHVGSQELDGAWTLKSLEKGGSLVVAVVGLCIYHCA